jgi:hypothetical protein
MFKNGFIEIGALIMFLVIAALCIGLISAIRDQYGEFEYTTISGETGTASYCTISYGQPRCQTADGTSLMVERYTKK